MNYSGGFIVEKLCIAKVFEPERSGSICELEAIKIGD